MEFGLCFRHALEEFAQFALCEPARIELKDARAAMGGRSDETVALKLAHGLRHARNAESQSGRKFADVTLGFHRQDRQNLVSQLRPENASSRFHRLMLH